MAPVFTWINHASYLFAYDGVRLVCDPWMSGTAFNRGWRLTSPTAFDYSDFSNVTHIWFSHQHPDHFSPPDLRKIPEADRARITVLFHKTIDKKVVRFCRGLRFKESIELDESRWVRLSPKVEVLCNGWLDRDSWIAVRTDDATILNINDCVVNSHELARSIARSVNAPIDVLLTQFSYANWVGNPEDAALRRKEALDKLERIRIQCEVFNPKYVLPFASYVWFCHEENFYHNAEMNRVGEVADFIEHQLQRRAVVLYPGDRWEPGTPHDWHSAADRYAADMDACIARGPVEASIPVPVERLERATADFLKRVKKRNPLIAFVPGLKSTMYLTDLDRTFALSLDGLQPLEHGDSPVDIELSSESLLFALKAPWGSNALGVNGRYRAPAGGDHGRFFRLFRAADLNDHGYGYDFRWMISRIRYNAIKRITGRAPSVVPRAMVRD